MNNHTLCNAIQTRSKDMTGLQKRLFFDRIITTVLFSGLILAILASLLFGTEGKSTEFPSATPESQGLASAALEKLGKIIQSHLEGDEIVGAELLIIKNRHNVFHKVFGMRNKEDKIPWEKHTICNIRSMTKPLTGAGIHVLIDEGMLKLSDRAADFLSGFKSEKCKNITIEQLLTHQSGLPLSIMDADSLDKYKDLIEMANTIGKKGPQFEPGSKFWYSDAGTDVLGAITEVVSKVSLNIFRKKRLLEPLGMKDSLTISKKNSFPKDRVASNYFGNVGSWKRFWKPSEEPFYPFAWGSQTLYSTPMDYAKFLAMWMDGGMAGGKQVLSKKAVSQMLAPVTLMSLLGTDNPYPTGFPGYKVYGGHMAMLYKNLKAADSEKPEIIGHHGSDGTFAWAWPDSDLMVLYFTQSRGGLTGMRLEKEIYKLLINPDFKEAASQIPEKYKPFIGQYAANFDSFKNVKFKVFMQDGNLAVDIPGNMIFELNEPDERGWRAFKLVNTISVLFLKDDSGKVKEMRIAEIIKLPRKSGAKESDESVPEECRPLLGEYTFPRVGIEVTILFQDDSLVVEIPGKGSLKVKKTADGKRWASEKEKGPEFFFEFNDSGDVTGMNLFQTEILPRED